MPRMWCESYFCKALVPTAVEYNVNNYTKLACFVSKYRMVKMINYLNTDGCGFVYAVWCTQPF